MKQFVAFVLAGMLGVSSLAQAGTVLRKFNSDLHAINLTLKIDNSGRLTLKMDCTLPKSFSFMIAVGELSADRKTEMTNALSKLENNQAATVPVEGTPAYGYTTWTAGSGSARDITLKATTWNVATELLLEGENAATLRSILDEAWTQAMGHLDEFPYCEKP